MKLDVVQDTPPPGRELLLGGGVFIVGQLSPLFIPLVASSDLNSGLKTVLSGLLLLGIPELAIFAAVAILGKPGFNWLIGRLFAIFKRAAPADSVGRGRYRLGLSLFCVPLLIGWLAPYVGNLASGYADYRIPIAIFGDGLLLLGLFLLGGDFWDKLRALFVHKARAHFPPD